MEKPGQPTNGHLDSEAFDWQVKGSSASHRNRRQAAADNPYEPNYQEPRRRPSERRENAFNLLAWLADGATGLIEELRHNDLGLSERFWVHAYAARRETLLALRALLDDMIEQTEQESRQNSERQTRRERRGGIDIEF